MEIIGWEPSPHTTTDGGLILEEGLLRSHARLGQLPPLWGSPGYFAIHRLVRGRETELFLRGFFLTDKVYDDVVL